MKTLLRFFISSCFILAATTSLQASHGLPLVNLTYTIGTTGVTISGSSDPATCGTGPYWMQAKVSCNPTSFLNTLPESCAHLNLQNWAGPGVSYNAFPWYSSLLNVPNYTAASGWPDQCALEAYNDIFIPYTDLCPGKVYYFAVRELVTSSSSIGNFGPVVSFTVPGVPVPEIPGSVVSNPATSPSNPSCGGGVLLSIIPPQGCAPKKTIPPGCTVCDTIVWRGPGGVVIAVNTLTVMVNPMTTSTYTVYWDTCNPSLKVGCGMPFVPTITVYVANTNALFSLPPTICSGTTLNLMAMYPAMMDSWSVTPTTSVTPSSSTSPFFNPTFDDPGTFVVTHQSMNGVCSSIFSNTIIVTPGIQSTILTSGGGCASSGGTGSATVAVTSSTTGLTYSWSPSGGTGASATGLTFNSTYTVTLSNGGCVITKTLQVTNNAGPSITSFSVDPPKCNGQTTGTISAIIASGNTPFSFTWTPGIAQHTQTITGIGAGTYSVFVLDNNGCFTSGTVSISQPAPLSLNTSSTIVLCAGNAAALTATANGGTPSYSYTWNPGNLPGPDTSVNPGSSIQYTCTAKDANGCLINHTTDVQVNPALTLASSVYSICIGNSIILTPTFISPGKGQPYQYIWSNGSTGASLTVPAGTSAGTTVYGVTVLDGCNPNANASFTVVTNANPIANIAADSLHGNAPLTVNFADLGSGGTAFNWNLGNTVFSTSQTTSTQYVTSGTYVVTYTVTNASGCKDYDTLTITVIDVVPQIVVPNVFTPNGDKVNDHFDIKAANLTHYECSVYNRWGRMVFSSSDVKNSWDGKINGTNAEEGTYFYVIKAGGVVGEDLKKQGYVSLFR